MRSTFNLWSTLLAETRRMARDRASLAETIGLELVARIEMMGRDVNFLSRKVHTVELLIRIPCYMGHFSCPFIMLNDPSTKDHYYM